MSKLPTDPQERKNIPIFSGVLKYFPRALAAVAECSKAGNDQHNPGKPLHWDRSKSGDELDALTRHLLQAGEIDSDGIRESTKIAWRALANLEKELEREASRKEFAKLADDLDGYMPSTPKIELGLSGAMERVQEPSPVCSPNGVADDWLFKDANAKPIADAFAHLGDRSHDT